MAQSPLRVAVIGTGSLGKEHARIYHELQKEGLVALAGVFDTHTDAARKVADRHGVTAFSTMAAAAAAADALSLVTPTHTHYDIARVLLDQGKHVLVEKPMADRAEQAAEMVEIAHRRHVTLQVGHVERFNPVFSWLQEAITQPRFIECHRLSPYPARSTDIGVVLDLMIHDLDVVLALVASPVTRAEAVGVTVLSAREDIANARLHFANGCVANLTASRISPERLRKIRVFSGGAHPSYVSLDYRAQEGFIYRIAGADEPESSLLTKLMRAKESAIVSEFAGRRIVREPVPINKEEPLRLELRDFVRCVQARKTPKVSGASAKDALDLAFEITRQIEASGSASRAG